MGFRLTDYPIALFAFSVVLLWLSAYAGSLLRRRLDEAARADYSVVLGASLTLLGLLIGFSFSLSVSRYNDRKNAEAAEANAIGTEYLRLELLPAAGAQSGRRLLREYTRQRIVWYGETDSRTIAQTAAQTDQLGDKLWAVTRDAGRAKPSPITALVASGMNDVLNAEARTAAAWLYRVPRSAWFLMFAIAVCANVLFGFSGHVPLRNHPIFVVFPVIVSIAFMLIADIDAPRTGFINVEPQNLETTLRSMQP